jgi:DNA-binding CsgD family transcriptional regulator
LTGTAVPHRADPTTLLGREAELAAVESFLTGDRGVACLVLSGDPGVGKTTVWEAALDRADTLGLTVASTRCSQSEAGLSFAGLGDLLDGEDLDDASIPAPQQHALEVALGRATATGGPVEPLAIAAGFLAVLRTLSRHAPVLLAIDDLQWLDQASAECLTFAARRLGGLPVRILCSRHRGRPAAVERGFDLVGVGSIELDGLRFGAVRELLHRRLGTPLPRRVVRQVFDRSQGNPLFAVELGRALVEAGLPEAGGELPVPGLVEDLLGARAGRLPPDVRRALLAVSLSAGLRRTELSSVVDPLVVEDAVSQSVLVEDRSVVRAVHPLLAAVVRSRSTASERRGLHLDLAAAVADPMLRIRHLAIATVRPDAGLASDVERYALAAVERGDLPLAEELAVHALRLTPDDDGARADRVLAVARCHIMTGDQERANAVLTDLLDALPPGRHRAMAHLLIGEGAELREEVLHLERAREEAADEPGLLALVLARRSVLLTVNQVERIDEAEQLALRATTLAGAGPRGTELDPRITHALAWARVLRGESTDDLADSTTPGMRRYESSIDRPRAVALAFRGEIAKARTRFETMGRLEDERGEAQFALVLNVQLCELELRSGRVGAATDHLDELGDLLVGAGPLALAARLRAVLAAVTGLPAASRTAAALVLDGSGDDLQAGWDRLEATRALGLAALADDDGATAVRHLSAVWDHTRREGVEDPGAFPVAGDLVEALTACGDVGTATLVVDRLEEAALSQDHPWGQVTVQRSRATIALCGDYDPGAAGDLRDAAGRFADLGLEFDAARSLLRLGALQRRHRKRADARRSLEESLAAFDRLGCTGWSGHARAELDRVSGRRAGGGELTPSERQVVDLAVDGRSNKEIATALFVSVYTVEAHLTHAYAKLGVRSRTQLARRLDELDPLNGAPPVP